jgi:hypothetical protein
MTVTPTPDRAADTQRIADLLHEAAETHHLVYRIVDGDDRTGPPGTPTG